MRMERTWIQDTLSESTYIIWKLYKKPYESIFTCTTRETESSLPNIMRKLHLLWKFAFYLRFIFTFTLLSYSKSILSQFTHKSHATERGGHSSTMFGFCSVNDLLLLLPLYHLLSNHITNFFTLGSNVSLILFKYSQKYEVFLHFDLRNCYFHEKSAEINSITTIYLLDWLLTEFGFLKDLQYSYVLSSAHRHWNYSSYNAWMFTNFCTKDFPISKMSLVLTFCLRQHLFLFIFTLLIFSTLS